MRFPWRRGNNDDDDGGITPPDMPREIEMVILATGKRYPLVPYYSFTDDDGVSVWRVVLHPDVDGDVFITEETGPVGLRGKMGGADKCALAFGFAQEDDGRIRIMRHDELRDDD